MKERSGRSAPTPTRRRRTAESGDTRSEILRAARHVLASAGYARLSMRAVAREARVAVGNVVYYFPTKRSLVHAVILALLEHYKINAQAYLHNAGGKTGFAELLRWYMGDSVSRDSSSVFRELWVMALHDPAIARAMDRFYDELHRLAAARLRVAWPELSRQRAHDIAQLLGTISEGTNPIYATAPRSGRSLARVARLSGELLMHAAATGAPQRQVGRGRRKTRAR
ncbi:MAG TPA: helix-turn-helix domain-containing protein [Steroidobacteraceae bacterium]|nr:helix-turn-helix domain-containing protein [Steroidobacteraceae bacterium]